MKTCVKTVNIDDCQTDVYLLFPALCVRPCPIKIVNLLLKRHPICLCRIEYNFQNGPVPKKKHVLRGLDFRFFHISRAIASRTPGCSCRGKSIISGFSRAAVSYHDGLRLELPVRIDLDCVPHQFRCVSFFAGVSVVACFEARFQHMPVAIQRSQ